MQASQVVVRFRNPSKTVVPDKDPFTEELERFSGADCRWRNLLEMAVARLTDGARQTLGVALSGLETGPAPRLLSYDFDPDDAEAMEREMAHMEPRLLSGIGLLSTARLGLGSDEIMMVQGIVTAVHRLLRIAKTRP